MMNEYPFTEWLDERLIDRQAELLELDQIAHAEQRARAISRELMHITFEIDERTKP